MPEPIFSELYKTYRQGLERQKIQPPISITPPKPITPAPITPAPPVQIKEPFKIGKVTTQFFTNALLSPIQLMAKAEQEFAKAILPEKKQPVAEVSLKAIRETKKYTPIPGTVSELTKRIQKTGALEPLPTLPKVGKAEATIQTWGETFLPSKAAIYTLEKIKAIPPSISEIEVATQQPAVYTLTKAGAWLANFYFIGKILPAMSVSKLVPFSGLSPGAARALDFMTHGFATGATTAFFDTLLNQFKTGQYNPKELAKESIKSGAYVSLISAPSAAASPIIRIGGAGLTAGSLSLLESAIEDGEISGEDATNALINSVTMMILTGLGTFKAGERYKTQEMMEISKNRIKVRIENTHPEWTPKQVNNQIILMDTLGNSILKETIPYVQILKTQEVAPYFRTAPEAVKSKYVQSLQNNLKAGNTIEQSIARSNILLTNLLKIPKPEISKEPIIGGGAIIDQAVLKPNFVSAKLRDISMKINGIITGDIQKSTKIGDEILKINPNNIDSPGKFYTEVSKVLEKNNLLNPQTLNLLKGSTQDFFMSLKEPGLPSAYVPTVEAEIPPPAVLAPSVTPEVKPTVPPITPEVMPKPSQIEVTPKVSKIDELYKEGITRTAERTEPPTIGLSTKVVHSQVKSKIEIPEDTKSIETHFADFTQRIKEIVKPFQFYPDLPLKLQNDIRINVIGALSKARDKVYNQISTALWGGLSENEIAQAVELIYARDQLSRTILGIGDPKVSVKQAQKLINELEKEISAESKEAAERYRTIQKEYKQGLVERGSLDPNRVIDDYVRHYVSDYTPDWVFNKGIPTRLKRPFRGYTIKAKGTTKEIRKDAEAILGQFLSIEYDNLIEDFILKQAGNYDVTPTLSREQKVKLFGVDKAGRVKSYGKPGRIYTIEGKRYRAYTPDIPFSRQLFPTDEGLMALGRYKKTYLVPENIYNAFRDFSEKGSPALYWANRVMGYWKTMAITSHFPSFNINNMIGDTWFALMQCPEPLKLFQELPTSLNYLSKKPENFNAFEKRLDKLIKDNEIIEATFMQAEVYRIKNSSNPVAYILNKARDISQFRESIVRTAYTSYLLKGQEAGKGAELIKYHNWIATQGLTETEALGKIARDVEIDYSWTSKTFNRIIRGLAMPFGTWYLKASSLAWRFTRRHLAKALLFFLSIPLFAALANNRDKKTKELEQKVPDGVKDRIHLILGENPDGTIKVWMPQLPQDVLIGTKFYSIAINQANAVFNKEKTIKEAATDTLKRWGIREAKGIAFLLAPMIRYLTGLVNDKDPFDKMPLYPVDKRKLPTTTRLYYMGIYLGKVMIPYLSQYLGEQALGKPPDLVKKDVIDKLVGWGALGVYDVTSKTQIKYIDEATGKEKLLDWDDYAKIQDLGSRETLILVKIENDWINSGLPSNEFLNTKEFQDSMMEIKKLWIKYNPKAENLSIVDIAAFLGERLENSLGKDTTSAQRWLQTQLERAKTPEEKRKIKENYEKIRQMNLIESIKGLPESSREIYLKAE